MTEDAPTCMCGFYPEFHCPTCPDLIQRPGETDDEGLARLMRLLASLCVELKEAQIPKGDDHD